MLKPKASNRTKSLVKWGGYSFEVWQNGDKNISYIQEVYIIEALIDDGHYFSIQIAPAAAAAADDGY